MINSSELFVCSDISWTNRNLTINYLNYIHTKKVLQSIFLIMHQMKLQQQNGKSYDGDLHLEPAATIRLIETANPKAQLGSARIQDKGIQLQE